MCFGNAQEITWDREIPSPPNTHTHAYPGHWPLRVRTVPTHRDTSVSTHCHPGSVLDTPSSLARGASPLSPPLTSAQGRRSQHIPDPLPASKILCLPSPSRLPHPRMGFVTGARGDRFFLQPGLKGRGHRAAFCNRSRGLLGKITALRNSDAPGLWGSTPSPHPDCPPFPMHSGKCSPLNASSNGERSEPGHKSQDSVRPERAAEGQLLVSAVPALHLLSRGGRTKGDLLPATFVS